MTNKEQELTMLFEEENKLSDELQEEIQEDDEVYTTSYVFHEYEIQEEPMEPDIAEYDNNRTFRCPICHNQFFYSWNMNTHHVNYPSNCDICEQSIKWIYSLSDIDMTDFVIPINVYKRTGYFTKKRGVKK